jgi:hypothetical protein
MTVKYTLNMTHTRINQQQACYKHIIEIILNTQHN